MPFNLKTPIGYILAFTLQYIGIKYLYMIGAAIVSFEIGCYLVEMEFIADIKNEVNSFNEIAKSEKNKSKTLTQLSVLIQFHTHVKQLSIFILSSLSNCVSPNCLSAFFYFLRLFFDVSNVTEPMLTVLFSWSIITICSAMLIGQMIIVQYSNL